MRLSTLVAICLVLGLTLSAFDSCEGLFGRRSRSRSSSARSSSSVRRSYSSRQTNRGRTVKVRGRTVHFGKKGIRNRDSTGHRTGLGTLGRSFVKSPVKTWKAINAFRRNYNQMRKQNRIGGNLDAHRRANKEATRIAGRKVAGAISGLREQYKRFRVKKNPDGSWHIGDTRTKQEIRNVMRANQKGRNQGSG